MSSSSARHSPGLLSGLWTALKRTLLVCAVPTIHTATHVAFSAPQHVDRDPLWSVGEAVRMETVRRRTPALEAAAKGLLGHLGGPGDAGWEKDKGYFAEDVVFEDPVVRLVGRDNLGLLFGRAAAWCEDGNLAAARCDVVHFQDMVSIEWQPRIRLRRSPWKGTEVTVPMRTNFYLERHSIPHRKVDEGEEDGEGGGGGPVEENESEERIWRIEEEWWGKTQLNSRTVFPSLLGSAYQAARRGVGFGVIALAKAGVI